MKCETTSGKPRLEDMSGVSTCFKEFERLILIHAMNSPPERLEIFKANEVKLLTDFTSTTLFKHFLLHQYCLNFDREVETKHISVSVQRPWAPAELVDLSAAKEVAKKAKEEQARSLEACEAAEGGEQAQEVSPENEELTEEQEVERLVLQKLEETKAKLEAKLQDREQVFLERLEQAKQN